MIYKMVNPDLDFIHNQITISRLLRTLEDNKANYSKKNFKKNKNVNTAIINIFKVINS
jgi:hypothetical protein